MIFETTLSLSNLGISWPTASNLTIIDFSMRVGLALILGSLIGAEREWKNKLAGLKTNALVCVGSALFTCIGYDAAMSSNTDPTRIVGQIASGIGFLGAGAILRDGLNIRGLTTAATVWCAAAIGTMAGAGMLLHAVVGTGFIFGCNLALKGMSNLLFKHHNIDAPTEQNYVFNFYTTIASPLIRKHVSTFFEGRQLRIRALNIELIPTGFHWVITMQHMHSQNEPLNTDELADKFWRDFECQLNWRLE